MLIHNFLLELYAENEQNNEHGQAKEKRGNRSGNCVAILKWTEMVKILAKCRETGDVNQE